MPPPAEGLATRLFLGPALRTQPDRRLVTLVREGYEAAFEEIVRRYGRPLGRYAASIVGNRSEDVTQDAFSKALLALQRNDAEIELRPWLFRIVRNTALNELRDSPPSPESLAEALAAGGNPAEELERREELADLMKRLRALPEPQRAAIVMRELEGLGHEEIAAALGLTSGGARQAIYRARQALRDGVGMLIPLPLLQALLAGGGSGVAETAAGAGMGAAGVGGAAGAGVALKATAATVLVAGAVGAGVAIKDNQPSGDAKVAPARVSQSEAGQAATAAVRNTGFSQERDDGAADGSGRGSGETEPGDDRGGHGGGTGSNHSGDPELVDDRRGHGGGEPELGGDHGGGSSGRRGGDSGHGSGDDRSGSSGHDGPGSSGSGRDGSGSGHDRSGSGHDGSGSGSGDGGSGSGHGGSGSGDSGSGDGSGSSGSGHDDLSGSGGPPALSAEPLPEETSGGDGRDGESGSGSGSGSDSGSGSGSGKDGRSSEDHS